jgi:hypothetical protein
MKLEPHTKLPGDQRFSEFKWSILEEAWLDSTLLEQRRLQIFTKFESYFPLISLKSQAAQVVSVMYVDCWGNA